MITTRHALAGLLAAALLAGAGPSSPAAEPDPLDPGAILCAERSEGANPIDGTEYQHFLAAAVRLDCLLVHVNLAEVVVEAGLNGSLEQEERRSLKRRRKQLRRLGAVAQFTRDGAQVLAQQQPGYEKIVRKILLFTTDLRFLGLESFRLAWQQVIAGAEARKSRILEGIDENLQRLADFEDAQFTKAGDRAIELAALAVVVSDLMDEQLAGLGLNPSDLPAFGTPEDRAARKRRKRFKGLGHDYGTSLVVLERIADRLDLKVVAAFEKALAGGACVPTSENVPSIGGGKVRIFVDGVPEPMYAGQTDVDFLDDFLPDLTFGSDTKFVAGRPYILFFVDGPENVRVGTHQLGAPPDRDPDGRRSDYVYGVWITRGPDSETRYKINEGTLTITRFKVGGNKKKGRVLEGHFDVIGRTSSGALSVHLTGTFHLCRFGREGEDPNE